MADRMREGGTGATSGKQYGYEMVEYYASRMPRYADGSAIHRGDTVHIAGDGGCTIYKVVALDDMNGEVQVADTLKRAMWMPATDLEHIPMTDKQRR